MTLHSILVDFNCALVWLVSILPMALFMAFRDYYYYFTPCEFFTLVPKVFHWSLSDSKSPYVSRTFLSILAHFCRATVRVVLILPLTSIFFSRFLGTVPSAPITICTRIIK